MAKPQIDQQVIAKLRAICTGETDHVTLMAVVTGELLHGVDEFDWVVSSTSRVIDKTKVFRASSLA